MSEGPIFNGNHLDASSGVGTIPHEEIPGQMEFIDTALKLIHARGSVYLSGREDRENILSNIDEDLRRIVEYVEEITRVAQ